MGYYLVDRGPALEAGIGYHPTWYAALGRFFGRTPLASYLGSILLVWLLTVIVATALGERLEVVRIAGPVASLLLLRFCRSGRTICGEPGELVVYPPDAAAANDAWISRREFPPSIARWWPYRRC